MLFEDPGRRSTSVGVTVSPVRIASIEQFGDLAIVGQRLLEAEGKKVRPHTWLTALQRLNQQEWANFADSATRFGPPHSLHTCVDRVAGWLLPLLQESTLDVQLLSSGSRRGSAGATLYDYEYELNSTRGVKRIFNTVTITGEQLLMILCCMGLSILSSSMHIVCMDGRF